MTVLQLIIFTDQYLIRSGIFTNYIEINRFSGVGCLTMGSKHILTCKTAILTTLNNNKKCVRVALGVPSLIDGVTWAGCGIKSSVHCGSRD